MENKVTYGIAWFNESDYQEWKRISEDELEDEYDHWLIEASKAKTGLEKEGCNVVKVTITPKNFMEWCKWNKQKPNSSARTLYVSELLLKSYSED